MKLTHLIGLTALMISPVAHAATTHIVNSAGGGDFTTIQAAIDAAASGDIVEVVDSGSTYTEALIIQKDLTLTGELASAPPVVALNSNSGTAFGNGDGLYIDHSGTVNIENLILIPGTLTDDMIMGVTTTSGTLNLNLTNLHLAPNNGSGAPLVAFDADDFATYDETGSTQWNDGIYLFGSDGASLGRAGTLNATLTDVRMFGSGADDSMVIYTGTGGSVTLSGVVVNGSTDDGIQLGTNLADDPAGATVTITGTKENPGLLLYQTGDGLSLFEGGSVTMDHFVAIETGGAFTQAGILLFVPATTDVSITDSLFANNVVGISFQGGPASVVATSVSDSTFYGNTSGIDLLADNTANAVLNIADTVFASNTTDVNNQGAGTVNLDSVAITQTVAPNGAASNVNAFTGNPILSVTTVPPLSTESFTVGSPDLEFAATDGGALSGYGPYVKEVVTGLSHWDLYR